MEINKYTGEFDGRARPPTLVHTLRWYLPLSPPHTYPHAPDLLTLCSQAPQTPSQRRANEKFANKEASKMGSYRPPKQDKETRRKMELGKQWRNQPTSTWVVIGLLVVLVGGGALELMRLFF